MQTVLFRIFASLLLLSSACLGQGASPNSTQQDSSQKDAAQQQDTAPTFRKNVRLVNVFFTAKDNHGSPVASLTKEDFEVLEDGKPQTIKYFASESNLPLTLGLLIDSSGSMQRMLPEEKVVGADFLRQVITDKDLAFVISFDISVDLLQDLTQDTHLLRTGLEKAKINVGGGSGGIPGIGQGPIPISHPKGTLLFDAIYLASSDVLGKQVGRKAMVVLTDGVDEGSRLKLRDAIEAAQKADVICYVLLLSDPQFGSNMHDMHEIAEQTGGRAIAVNRPDKIGDAFEQISRELRNQYSVGYSPENAVNDGKFRKIEVKSKGPRKVQIQARKGYYAPLS
ncbi:MAG TPA: VWA domain-containing protein [Candidatus Angelobacter sp.]|nr:VWA domain-containing protein [Candidatus Angelobacter sp.]